MRGSALRSMARVSARRKWTLVNFLVLMARKYEPMYGLIEKSANRLPPRVSPARSGRYDAGTLLATTASQAPAKYRLAAAA